MDEPKDIIFKVLNLKVSVPLKPGTYNCILEEVKSTPKGYLKVTLKVARPKE